MFDTHAIARALANADLTPAQAAEHEARDLVTRADLYRALLLQTGVLMGPGSPCCGCSGDSTRTAA